MHLRGVISSTTSLSRFRVWREGFKEFGHPDTEEMKNQMDKNLKWKLRL